MKDMNIAVIGLGLIGGSICKALKSRLNTHIITAVDKNIESLELALSDGIINKGIHIIDKNLKDSDIIFICTPVEQTIDILKKLVPFIKHNCIITDVGSTKQHIVFDAESIIPPFSSFIGGHPMAGSEKSGYMASSAHLFENALYILSPGIDTPDDAILTLKTIIASIGAIPIIMNPELHDRTVAAISHLPHIISAGLVNVARCLEKDNHYIKKLAAGGFKDITRISSSDPEMWKDICSNNKKEIKKLLTQYIASLESFINALDNNDKTEVHDYFQQAKDFRDNIPEVAVGLIYPLFEIIVDVEDKPGIISDITTLLAKHQINIKNISIINMREDEPGCLKLSFNAKKMQEDAFIVLQDNKYKCYLMN